MHGKWGKKPGKAKNPEAKKLGFDCTVFGDLSFVVIFYSHYFLLDLSRSASRESIHIVLQKLIPPTKMVRGGPFSANFKIFADFGPPISVLIIAVNYDDLALFL